MRADGARAKAAGSALSDFLRRALHSLTARRQPPESAQLERPPKSRSVSTASRPLLVEPGQIRLKGALSNPEDVRALSAKNLPDQPAAVSCAAHDLLDRDPLLGEGENGRVRLLAADVSFILQFLGKGQKRRVDHRGPHRRSDLPHRLSDSVKKRAARIFHQMPAVGDLDGMGKRPLGRDRVAASTIPGDDANLRLMRQPGLSRHGLPIGQKCDRPPPLKVADQRAVAVVTSPRPIVDADNRGRRKASRSTRRTTRSRVSLLTSMLSRREREAAGRPPSAIARQCTTSSSRLVRLPLGSTASNRSAKIRLAQVSASQTKRRVRKISAIRAPAAGRSAKRL